MVWDKLLPLMILLNLQKENTMKTSQEIVYLSNAIEALVCLHRENSVEGREFRRWLRSPKKKEFIAHAFNMKVQLEREGKGTSLYHLQGASMVEVTAFTRIFDYGFKYEVAVRDEDDCIIEMGRFSQQEGYLAKYVFLLCASNKYLEKQKIVLDQIVRNDHIKHS